ncbi:uncharacterized protein LOC131954146 [Physella acuta]|uniref:uncharacterized protein LOC131954146 n=1 Tax=Physella acuta TaxID=109671 RepID=UPI0027DC27E3|nr:uncharacterized protein LOC131954146 [Physella acuta]
MKIGVALLLAVHLSLVESQIRSHLTFHLVTLDQGSVVQSEDVSLESNMEYTQSREICKSPGNVFTYRISPGNGGTDLMDDTESMTSDTKGALSCLYPTTLTNNTVTCKFAKFCTEKNNCTAALLNVCPETEEHSSWEMTQAMDITIQEVGERIVVTRCFAVCQNADRIGGNYGDKDAPGLSDLAIGFIVAGVIVLAFVIVGASICWRIVIYKNFGEEKKKVKRVEFVS